MSVPRRKRASFLLLLVLAAGFAFAGAAAGASAPEMACCPAGMGMMDTGADARGCAWLGAGDCCPERPTAPAPSSAAPPAPAPFLAPVLPPLRAVPAASAACAFRAPAPPRSDVLRL